MKNKLLLPIIAIMTVVLAACGASGPDKTVDNFFGSVKKLELENVGEHLSKDLTKEYEESLNDQDMLGEDEFTFDDMKKLDEYKEFEGELKKLTSKLKHKITDTKTDGDKSTVTVELTYADASEPLLSSVQSIFGELMGMAFSGQEPDNDELVGVILNSISKNLKDAEISTENSKGSIELIKEDGNWVISEVDDEVANALLFGAVKGADEFDPFGSSSFGGELTDENFEPAEGVNLITDDDE